MPNQPAHWISHGVTERWTRGDWSLERSLQTGLISIYRLGELVQQLGDLDQCREWVRGQEEAEGSELARLEALGRAGTEDASANEAPP